MRSWRCDVAKQVERIMLEEQSDGWAVEARVSGLTLEEAAGLQAFILGVSAEALGILRRMEAVEAANPRPLAVTVNLPDFGAKAPEAKAEPPAKKPRAAHREPNLRTMVAEANGTPAPQAAADVMVAVDARAYAESEEGPPEPVEVVPPPAKKPLVADGEVGDAELVMRLADAPKLRDVLLRMGEAGVHGTGNLITVAARIKDRVPVLARIGDLRERITRAAEVLGVSE